MIKHRANVAFDEWMNSIYFWGHWSEVKVVDQCGLCGDVTLCVVWLVLSCISIIIPFFKCVGLGCYFLSRVSDSLFCWSHRYHHISAFLCPRIEWSGAYCFCPVCLLLTLTFAITFEPLEIETSYLACILHLWCPFKWHQCQWPCDLDFDLEAKNSFFDFVAAGGILLCFTNSPWFFFFLKTSKLIISFR